MALSSKPYKGARDFYPEDKRLQKYMFDVWRNVAESYGYEEYDAPILEPLDIYLAKTGEEIVNEQTYVFEDRGGRKVVIRPEMTPTVSRMVAAKRQELIYPVRWYSIPNLWRYERPQRGRLREHWQLNVDIFGVEDVAAEFEIISLVNDVFQRFGASDEMYEIRLNHRGLIDFLLDDYLKLGKAKQPASKLIDRMAKMSRPAFIAKLDDVLSADLKQAGVTEKLLGILDAKTPDDLPAEALKQPAAKELIELLSDLKAAGIKNVRFDATLMRGFDYYTGIVFEVFDKDPENNRSMMGGGRYDGLVGLFGVAPVPTVGFGWGDVTLVNFLETHRLKPELKAMTKVMVLLAGDVSREAQSVIKEFRAQRLFMAVDYTGKKLGDQLKNAGRRGVNFALILGENELKQKKYKLKDLRNGKEYVGSVKELTDIVVKNS